MSQKNKINKKAQEEMVGFVLIVLVVAIMFLVFLGIYLRGASKVKETESIEILSFLEAVSKLTTDCSSSQDSLPYDVSELILECYENPLSKCSDNREKCEVLKKTLFNAVNSSWNFDVNSRTKAFFMQIFRETDRGEIALLDKNNNPIQPTHGSFTRNIRSAEKPFSKGLILRLRIYY